MVAKHHHQSTTTTIIIIFMKSCQKTTYMYTQSIRVCIQHRYEKIVTEQLGAFVNQLSVVASCSEIAVMICFIRKQR